MSLWELFILAVGLSMDAFAVSVCKGLAIKKVRPVHLVITGLWLGGFQALMPFIGYHLSVRFNEWIQRIDHWIVFLLLGAIGTNMLREALAADEGDTADASLAFKTMFMLAVATSIDALAAGVTFAFLDVNINFAVSVIGIVTFCFSAAGVKLGSVFGTKYRSKAEFAGGVILILLGVKILIEHLFFS